MLNWEMLVDKYSLATEVTGIVHCGAHQVEEASRYAELGVPVWWIEANPALADTIRTRLAAYTDQQLIMALLADKDNRDMVLHISGPDYAGSSSVLEWGTHTTFSPLRWVDHVTLKSRTLDSLWEEHGFVKANMVVTDLQGLDPVVLAAGMCLLEQCQFVMCEVNKAQVYQGCVEFDDLVQMMAKIDPGPPFEVAEICWVGDQNWGDCLFARADLL